MLVVDEQSVPCPPRRHHSPRDLAVMTELRNHQSSAYTHLNCPSSILKKRVSASRTKEDCASANLQARVLEGHSGVSGVW